jgi:enediyne biosynthesis protein E3
VGYYEGMFRSRHTVRSKTIPDQISAEDLHSFDQGLGRSLWYIAKGVPEQLRSLIEAFPASRLPDLWRGAGIAVAYVGGTEESFQTIYKIAGPYAVNLAAGAVFLAHSRIKAATLNEETEAVCRCWCHATALQVAALLDQTEPLATGPGAYMHWVRSVEEGLHAFK